MRSLNTLRLISASVRHVLFPACPMSHAPCPTCRKSCDANHMTFGKPVVPTKTLKKVNYKKREINSFNY
jgi:hypothetical protein